MEQLFPIEKPSKSGSIGAHRSEGGAFEHGKKEPEKGEKKERRFGWSLDVAPKPDEGDSAGNSNKYMRGLSNIKDKASGIDIRSRDSVVKPWDFNTVTSDPSQKRYGNSLANLKNSIKGKNN
jgi:hypothetical protein